MGFKDEVNAILQQCKNPKRQTIMVSATLNQDLKELAKISLKEALTFTVQQQQRKADLANLKLTQYLVRLKFDDVEKPPPRQKKTIKEPVKKRRKFTDKDFDSEEEYAQGIQEDDSDVEYDDGKIDADSSESEYDDGKESVDDLDESEADEEGEHEMEESAEELNDSEESYLFEKDEAKPSREKIEPVKAEAQQNA